MCAHIEYLRMCLYPMYVVCRTMCIAMCMFYKYPVNIMCTNISVTAYTHVYINTDVPVTPVNVYYIYHSSHTDTFTHMHVC